MHFGDPAVLGAIFTAVGVVVSAFFVWLGKRGVTRQRAEKAQAEADLNRLRALLDEHRQDIDRERAESARLRHVVEQQEGELEFAHSRIRQLENQ